MRLALILFAIPTVVFAVHAWRRALDIIHADAKEAAALSLARRWPPFARAYAASRGFAAIVHARPDYVVRMGR